VQHPNKFTSHYYWHHVGILFGSNKTGKHAANIFLDENADVKILEPQNGTVIEGKDWEYTPNFMVMYSTRMYV
jgi:hypothetical protein